MLYQKSSYLLMVLLSIFLAKNSGYAQDSSSVKLGFFGGSGIFFNGSLWGGIEIDTRTPAYHGGIQMSIQYKKRPKIRNEIFLQWCGKSYSHETDLNLAPDSYHTTKYAKFKRNFSFIDLGIKWQFGIINKKRYRLFVSPIISFAIVTLYRYSSYKEIYNYDDNYHSTYIIESEMSTYPGNCFAFRIGGSLDQEFKLTKNMFLNLNLYPLHFWFNSQKAFLNSTIWGNFSASIGLSWLLNRKESMNHVIPKK